MIISIGTLFAAILLASCFADRFGSLVHTFKIRRALASVYALQRAAELDVVTARFAVMRPAIPESTCSWLRDRRDFAEQLATV